MLLLGPVPVLLWSQVCRVSVAGLNQSRRVRGPVRAECPGLPLHTAPFGNWGVTSNFGVKQNGHQFQGWCHDTRTCDNQGACAISCRDGWYEWNSCTDHDRYKPPNCSLYNAGDCTEQATATGINVHGTRTIDVPVACPAEGRGGCRDLTNFSAGPNFMSLYELDPGGPDELIQTMHFPPTPVALTCDAWGCGPAGSAWVAPSAYDSPAAPPVVFAEMAMVVNWAAFVDLDRRCGTSTTGVNAVSGASFAGSSASAEGIVTLFGEGLAPVSAAASALPLPTSLGSTSVRITDRSGVHRFAPLFFVSPGQVNLLIPAGTPTGPATISLYRGDIPRATGNLQIEPVAPGLFTANADGRGVAGALVVTVREDGTQTVQPVFTCGTTPRSCVPAPLEFGPAGNRLFLLLFGTGIRGRSALSAVTVTIGGQAAEVLYAGPQSQFAGLDQVNVTLPRTLIGRGEAPVDLAVDGRRSNVVTIHVR
jgi:uncharacterized protein (TIGR03437 family)